MCLLQDTEGTMTNKIASRELRGIVGWVCGLMQSWPRERTNRQMQLIETLALGGKKQLMLVSCGGEQFLVGGGSESIDSIVRLGAESPAGMAANRLETSCR